jgi:hypothetical protein
VTFARGHPRGRRWLAAWPALVLGGSALAVGVLALTVWAPERPPTEREVASQLRQVMARRGFRLHEVRCFRDEVLQRRFDCLVEGADDLHLAVTVRALEGGRLAVRGP